jgi:hypothetical protein
MLVKTIAIVTICCTFRGKILMLIKQTILKGILIRNPVPHKITLARIPKKAPQIFLKVGLLIKGMRKHINKHP